MQKVKNTNFQTERVLYNAENFLSYFEQTGCHSCLISPNGDERIIDHLDIVVIPGGPDIDPALYGQVAHKHTHVEKEGKRDFFERNIIKLALEKGKPIFAVCRGLQMINAVLGGTLHQHLPDIVNKVPHRSSKGPLAHAHTVKTSGWLKDAIGEEVHVNSWHHQGIAKLAPDLEPLAWAADGLIEAYESKNQFTPILAVQWHPEILQDRESMALLAHFIEKLG